MHHAGAMDKLFAPQSIAIVGASRHPGKTGHEILANLMAGGFPGRIYPVNPHAETILGLPCLPSLRSCPMAVHLVVLAIPPALVLQTAREAAGRGCGALLVLAPGSDDDPSLVHLCREREILLLGPDCHGLMHGQQRLNLSRVPAIPPVGGISVLTQSGGVGYVALSWLAAHGLGLCQMISLGRQLGLTDADLLDYLAHDPQTRVIACYLEGIRQGEAFLKAVAAASRHKPVILYQAGMAQPMPAMESAFHAACQRSGAVWTATMDAWFEAMATFASQPLPAGCRVGVITQAASIGRIARDALVRHDLTVAVSLDLEPRAVPEQVDAALSSLLADPAVDALLVMAGPMAHPPALAIHAPGGKPLLTAWMNGQHVPAFFHYPSPEKAVAALAQLCHYAQWRKQPPRVVTRFPINQRRAQRVLHRYRLLDSRRLSVVDSRELLQAYGFGMPEAGLAATLEEALDWAQRLGFPLNMQLNLLDEDLQDEPGLTARHLTSPEGVRDAFDLITLRFAKNHPARHHEGIHLARIPTAGQEVSLGMIRDPLFGAMLMFGPGRSFVGVVGGRGYQWVPITGDEALAMLADAQTRTLLQSGHGGQPPNLQAIAECLQRLSQLAADLTDIQEVRIMPLRVGRPGTLTVVEECTVLLSPGMALP